MQAGLPLYRANWQHRVKETFQNFLLCLHPGTKNIKRSSRTTSAMNNSAMEWIAAAAAGSVFPSLTATVCVRGTPIACRIRNNRRHCQCQLLIRCKKLATLETRSLAGPFAAALSHFLVVIVGNYDGASLRLCIRFHFSERVDYLAARCNIRSRVCETHIRTSPSEVGTHLKLY